MAKKFTSQPKSSMTLRSRQEGSHSHLWPLTLTAIAAIVLLEPAASLAVAQNPPEHSPYASRQSTPVRPPLAAKDSSQARSNVSSSGSRDSPAHTTRHAQPAAVTLKDGTLTIEANDSDLSQILQSLSRQSGMIIQGTVTDVRVFCNYGPRDPGDILTELLTGLGYNIIMVGTTHEAVPRELMLTSRPDGPSPALPVKGPERPAEDKLGPGAIAHPPPAQVDDPQVRTQQNLRRLEQMHESQGRENAP
jgi:hypothetical protein